MRKIHLLLFMAAWLSSFSANAGTSYAFTQRTETYTELVSGSPLFVHSIYFDTLSPGFNFRMNGVTGAKLYLFLRGTMSTSGSFIDSTRFEPFSAEHGRGTYSYEISGPIGDRILKLQFKNLKFDHDIPATDYMNFQVWLFEVDNAIEIHFGNSSITNPDWSYYFQQGGPAIGGHNAWLSGNAASPVLDTASGSRVTGTPANGKVYRFSLPTSGITQSMTRETLSVYPNPAGEMLQVSRLPQGMEYIIRDASGRIVTRGKLQHDGICISALLPGQYFLQFRTLVGEASGVFIKR